MKWKYVIVEREGLETPFIFPPWVQHVEIKRLGKPVSAGFVTLDAGSCELVPHGRSESLKLEPREQDRVLLTKLLSNPYT